MTKRPELKEIIGKDPHDVPLSCQRILGAECQADSIWIGPEDAAKLTEEELDAYSHAHTIIRHLAVRMPRANNSGHPGGPLSAFTFAYWITKMRNPTIDQPLRYSAGHLSVLAYTLQYLFGRHGNDDRLSSVPALIDNFRVPSGLPGHVEAGIGDIPFGTGPLGKGVSNALGVAFGLKYLEKKGLVDVVLADGDAQEGQVMEAFRLASKLRVENLIVHGDFNDIQLSGIPSSTMASDFASIAVACGWIVIEVQNGNDPAQVKAALARAEESAGNGKPVFVCYYTTMGSGISLMENGSNTGNKNYHGAPLSDKEAEQALSELPDLDRAISSYEKYRQTEIKRYTSHPIVNTDIELAFDSSNIKGYSRSIVTEEGAARKDFGAVHLLNLMKADPRIFVLHADLAGSGGFEKVEEALPHRIINVGVAEANMYMMAAGMRQAGLLPATYTFAAFGTNEARANTRLIDVNCSHTRCGVLHDCTHAGLSVGEDGETHQERHYLDIPFDHTESWIPADSNQAAAMAETALMKVAEGHTSVFIFFPRSSHPQLLTEQGDALYDTSYAFDGSATIVHGRGDFNDYATIIASGICVHDAIEAAKKIEGLEKVSIRVLNVACIRPIDTSKILEAGLETMHLIVVEDHSSASGLASVVAGIIADFRLPCSLRRLGVNQYYPSGKDSDLKILAGLDSESISNTLQDELRMDVCGGDDVITSTLFSFAHYSAHSIFGKHAARFADRLLSESGYMESLRSHWKKKRCPSAKIPANEVLRERLRHL